MQDLLVALASLPPALVYLVLGAGAALENVVPPIPADTFVVLGGFLAARGPVDPWIVFFVTWGANVGSAVAVYTAGHRFGRPFFETGWGRRLLHPTQLAKLDRFYRRWGHYAVFFTRFLPGLRAVVPGFAGVTHQRFLPVAIPVASASALWYGALVWFGATAGRNVDVIGRWLQGANRLLVILATVVGLAALVWWLYTRERELKEHEGEEIPIPEVPAQFRRTDVPGSVDGS